MSVILKIVNDFERTDTAECFERHFGSRRYAMIMKGLDSGWIEK